MLPGASGRGRLPCAQAGAHLVGDPVTDTNNNGINTFIKVRRRANHIVPSRTNRSFPLLPGRASVLYEQASPSVMKYVPPGRTIMDGMAEPRALQTTVT